MDDGSYDRTNQIAQEYSRQYSSQSIRVVTEHHNRGKGGAIKWVWTERSMLSLGRPTKPWRVLFDG